MNVKAVEKDKKMMYQSNSNVFLPIYFNSIACLLSTVLNSQRLKKKMFKSL